MLLSAGALLVVALSPAVIITAVVLMAATVEAIGSHRHAAGPSADDLIDFWSRARLDYDRRRPVLGTPEVAEPARVSLLTATLEEAQDYLRSAKVKRRAEHVAFLYLMSGARYGQTA